MMEIPKDRFRTMPCPVAARQPLKAVIGWSRNARCRILPCSLRRSSHAAICRGRVTSNRSRTDAPQSGPCGRSRASVGPACSTSPAGPSNRCIGQSTSRTRAKSAGSLHCDTPPPAAACGPVRPPAAVSPCRSSGLSCFPACRPPMAHPAFRPSSNRRPSL